MDINQSFHPRMNHPDQFPLNPNDILIKETAGLDIGAFKFLTLHPSLLPPMLRSYIKDQNELIFNSDNLFTNYLQSHFCAVETPLPNQEAIKELDRCVRSNNFTGRLSYFEGSNCPNTTLDLPVLEFLSTRKKSMNAAGFVRYHLMPQGADFEVHNLLKIFKSKKSAKADKKKLFEKVIKRKYTKRKKPGLDPNNPNLNHEQAGNFKPEELAALERKRREKEDRQFFSKEPIRRTPHSHRITDPEVVRHRIFPKEDKEKYSHKTAEKVPCECGIQPDEVRPGNLCKKCFRRKQRRENILFQPETKTEAPSRAERMQQRRSAKEDEEEGEESEEEDLLNPKEIKETRIGSNYQADIPSFSVARPNKIIKDKIKDWGPDLLESKRYTFDEVQELFRQRVLESFKRLEAGRKETQDSSIDKLRKEVEILIDQEITAKRLHDLGFDSNKFLNWLRLESEDFESFLSQHKTHKQARMKQFNVQKQLGR